MKYRIVECKDGKSQWYEIYYQVMFMWFPVMSVPFKRGVPKPRTFSTKEQAEFWVSLRIPVTDELVAASPVERRVVSEHGN